MRSIDPIDVPNRTRWSRSFPSSSASSKCQPVMVGYEAGRTGGWSCSVAERSAGRGGDASDGELGEFLARRTGTQPILLHAAAVSAPVAGVDEKSRPELQGVVTANVFRIRHDRHRGLLLAVSAAHTGGEIRPPGT